tara:strand:+ start:928 stop:2205 length:1278 start_codon:yes stop_codon:yes gene_type:complete
MKLTQLDIFDINMVFDMLLENPPKRERRLHEIITEKLLQLMGFVVGLKPKKYDKNIDVLFFGASSNNQKVFKPIINEFDLISCFHIKDNKDFPLIKAYLFSVPFVVCLYRKYMKGSVKERQLIRKHPIQFFLSYGKVRVAFEILEKINPKLLIMANDHSPFNRALLLASKELNIKSLYLQHASVTKKFPCLEFDYSFLDGEESFEKYKSTSKLNSKVLLTGSPRFDSFYKVKKNIKSKNVKNIGISINQFDDFETIKNLCLKISTLNNVKVIVRPHPNMVNWNKNWFTKNRIQYSDSTVIPSNVFLKFIDIQISNICGIHLDAILINTPTVQFKLSKEEINDQYEFLEKGLIQKAFDFIELENFIHNPALLSVNKNKLRHFIASSNSKIEGMVGKFVARYIEAILQSQKHEKLLERNYNIKVFEF